MAFIAATDNFVETPRGFVMEVVRYTNAGKPLKVRSELVWNKGFGQKLNRAHLTAQEFLDHEILKFGNKYAPKVSSMLIRSGILGTEIGSGEVAWIAPYARYQYELVHRRSTQNSNELFDPAQPQWVARAWAIHGDAIMEGVNRRIRKGL